MHESAVLIVVIVILTLVFDFINGFHDTANAIATVVATRVLTDEAELAFQDYFVRCHCAPGVRGLRFDGAESAQLSDAARTAFASPELEAIVIATPVRLHYEMAKACLAAGKHAFVEKPMARTAAEAEELVATAERKGLVLMVGHTFLFSPAAWPKCHALPMRISRPGDRLARVNTATQLTKN